MKTYSKKSAFSLIELSIVLIIIGLLIAGITGGASLIKSATLRAVMTEARNYNTAVNSFYVAYNAYPGDYTVNFASGVATGYIGDGDGRIEFNSTSGGTVTATGQGKAEGFGAVAMLAYTKMITTETLTAGSATSVDAAGAAGTTIPQSKVRGTGWIFDYLIGTPSAGVGTNNTSWVTEGQNAVILTSGWAAGSSGNISSLLTSATSFAKGALTAEDAKSVDLKLDDGLPLSGKVRSFGKSSTADCIVSASSTYNETVVKTTDCALTYAIDVTS